MFYSENINVIDIGGVHMTDLRTHCGKVDVRTIGYLHVQPNMAGTLNDQIL